MKNIHPFNVSSIERERSVSIQTCNLRIFASEIFKGSKRIALNVFSKILISLPTENFSPHYQSGFFISWNEVGSVFNGTETIALLGPKNWDLVLLVINQKKYVNVF